MSAPRSPVTTIAPGVTMPLLGLGTYGAGDGGAQRAVSHALDVGYRLFDTATTYRNERGVGRAIRESGVPREDVFVTTKLPSGNAGRVRQTIAASLDALGLDRVDLWLIHWPPGGRARPDTWEQFVAVRAAGLTRAIGVSNYSAGQIDELIEATGVAPAVNQIRWAPALYDPRVAREHRDRGVTLEGWSPFRATRLDDPVLLDLAADHGVTTRQVVLRWHIDHGFVAIPKSADPGRIAENFDVFGFALDDDEIARIDALGR